MIAADDVGEDESNRMGNEIEDWRLTICIDDYDPPEDVVKVEEEKEEEGERKTEVVPTEVDEGEMSDVTKEVLGLFEGCFEQRLSLRRLAEEQKIISANVLANEIGKPYAKSKYFSFRTHKALMLWRLLLAVHKARSLVDWLDAQDLDGLDEISVDMRMSVAAEVGKCLQNPSLFSSHKEYTRLCALLLSTDFATRYFCTNILCRRNFNFWSKHCHSFFKMLSIIFEDTYFDVKICKHILPPAKLSPNSAKFHRKVQRGDVIHTSSDEVSPSWAQGIEEEFITQLEKLKDIILDRSLHEDRCYRVILSPYFHQMSKPIHPLQNGTLVWTPQVGVMRVISQNGRGNTGLIYCVKSEKYSEVLVLKTALEWEANCILSMQRETAKTKSLNTIDIPCPLIIEMGDDFCVREWIEGDLGVDWIRKWIANGRQIDDQPLCSLFYLFDHLARRGIYLLNLKGENMLWNGETWVVLDYGGIRKDIPYEEVKEKFCIKFDEKWLQSEGANGESIWDAIIHCSPSGTDD